LIAYRLNEISLLGLAAERDLASHPKVGASWEGFAIEQVLRTVRPDAAHFWATHTGAELDLLLFVRGRRYGIEVKYQDAPRLTPSMRIAPGDLGLERLTVLYPGDRCYDLDKRVAVVPLADLAALAIVRARGRRAIPPSAPSSRPSFAPTPARRRARRFRRTTRRR
jgi:predicted AAA+ superfamily ATPase